MTQLEAWERLRHSASFGGAAAAYAEHRPDYAQAAVDWALSPAPGPRVLDLGAGTGKLTAALLALGAEVIAVEPDLGMLVELRRGLPTARVLAGRAEAIPLEDGSVDAILVGNALHWFDMDAAGPELVRVLAPGGVLSGLWNVLDDRADWIAGLSRMSGGAAIGARDTLSRWRAGTADIRLPQAFACVERSDFAHAQRRTADTLVATLATRAGLLVTPDFTREFALGQIRRFLASRPETAQGEFELPMMTGVLRVRRR